MKWRWKNAVARARLELRLFEKTSGGDFFLPFVAIATSVDLLKRIRSMDHIIHFCWQALIGRIVDRPFKKLSVRGLVTPLFFYLDGNSVVLELVASAEPL